MGYNDTDLTLGDLRRLDEDNFQHLEERECREYQFDTPDKAKHFMGRCFDTAMKKCGVKVAPGMPGKMIERLMEINNVKVENRKYPEDELIYVDGIYIYKNREIAYFISVPHIPKENMIWTGQGTPYVKIKTNVRLD